MCRWCYTPPRSRRRGRGRGRPAAAAAGPYSSRHPGHHRRERRSLRNGSRDKRERTAGRIRHDIRKELQEREGFVDELLPAPAEGSGQGGLGGDCGKQQRMQDWIRAAERRRTEAWFRTGVCACVHPKHAYGDLVSIMWIPDLFGLWIHPFRCVNIANGIIEISA